MGLTKSWPAAFFGLLLLPPVHGLAAPEVPAPEAHPSPASPDEGVNAVPGNQPLPRRAAGEDELFVPEPLPPPLPGARIVADTGIMLANQRQASTLEQLVGERDAELIRQINATKGTYQSYLLYTCEDLPEIFFHPGFTITLPPPRKNATTHSPAPAVARPPQPPPTAQAP